VSTLYGRERGGGASPGGPPGAPDGTASRSFPRAFFSQNGTTPTLAGTRRRRSGAAPRRSAGSSMRCCPGPAREGRRARLLRVARWRGVRALRGVCVSLRVRFSARVSRACFSVLL